jgi:hypothetical protein
VPSYMGETAAPIGTAMTLLKARPLETGCRTAG